MTWAVKLENVSKRYRGPAWGYASLRDDLMRLGRNVRGLLTSTPPQPRGILALDDISFEVEAGEAFAIIGPNGAGKTTTLKLLTRITYPTSGRIRVRGRVGALIEVGSGVHPELTGRENVWLYGRILGMSRQEIARRFDQIVEFAELEHALDLPVKMYSSGMQLRLGFAVASHLDPDIFVVDEALAVGDAGFQAKCVERMMYLIRQGKTLLFVSHNLYAVETLCPRGMYLRHGMMDAIGPIRDVLRRYLDDIDIRRMSAREDAVGEAGGGPISMSVRCVGPQGNARLETGDTLQIVCDVSCTRPGTKAYFHFGITDGRSGMLLLASQVLDGHQPMTLGGRDRIVCIIPDLPLLPRVYEIWGEVRSEHGWGNHIDWQLLAKFQVIRNAELLPQSVSHAGVDAPIHVPFSFERHPVGADWEPMPAADV